MTVIRVECDNAARHPKGQPKVWIRTVSNTDPLDKDSSEPVEWFERYGAEQSKPSSDTPMRDKDRARRAVWNAAKAQREMAKPRTDVFLIGDTPVDEPLVTGEFVYPDAKVSVTPEVLESMKRADLRRQDARYVFEWKCRYCEDSLTVRQEQLSRVLDLATRAGRTHVTLAEIRSTMDALARIARGD